MQAGADGDPYAFSNSDQTHYLTFHHTYSWKTAGHQDSLCHLDAGDHGSRVALAREPASLKLHLIGNAWSGIFLGETNYPWGYLVDVTPLEPSVDGAHIETYIRTWFDGTQWVDYLFVGLPHPDISLDVRWISTLPRIGSWLTRERCLYRRQNGISFTWVKQLRMLLMSWMSILYSLREMLPGSSLLQCCLNIQTESGGTWSGWGCMLDQSRLRRR